MSGVGNLLCSFGAVILTWWSSPRVPSSTWTTGQAFSPLLLSWMVVGTGQYISEAFSEHLLSVEVIFWMKID